MKQHGRRRRRQGALERLRKNLANMPAVRKSYESLLKEEDGKKRHEDVMKRLDSDEGRMKREIATLEERLGPNW